MFPCADPGPRASLLPFLADHHLPYVVPAIFYWLISFGFHYIDTRGLFTKYKLHTSAEDLTKNRASRKDVIKFALIQQAANCTLGYLMANDSEQFVSPEYATALWAQRLRNIEVMVTRCVPYIGYLWPWAAYESNGSGYAASSAIRPGTLGNLLSNTTQALDISQMDPTPFTSQEIVLANAMYWVLVPLFQYIVAMVLADTLQYFTHRAFHVNKWLYKHVHSMHHDIYVPFAYGAFYNHPLETIPVDGIGFPYCLAIAGLDNRQAALVGAIWTFKTVVDHCGYDFPYNPCNILCPNSVLFHDLHHQTWGMKYNFSVYGAFWDWIMGTSWNPYDSRAQAKYQRGKATAEAVTAKAKLRSQESTPALGTSTALSLEDYNHRGHPSEEDLKRNHVTKWECLKVVVRYHIMQISIDFLPDYGNKQAMTGDEACITYDTALVVRSLRNIVAILPATLGIHAKQLSLATSNISPAFARIIAGSSSISTSTFPNSHTNIKPTSLELTLAKFAINYLYPAWQYTLALIVVDTWIYFTHRLCHINSTL